MAAPFQNLPEQRQLLDAIAAGESSGYDVLYGGGRFQGYADHPRQAIPIASGPNQGKTSSAAGRYQFLAPTWDATAKELGLKDFSPENQDMAAWHLAAKTYETKTGRDLLADIREGRTQDIAPSLAGVWTSIPGGIEPNKATAGFIDRLGTAPAPQMPAFGWSPPAATPAAVPDTQPSSLGVLGAVAAGDNSQQRGGVMNFADPLLQMPPPPLAQYTRRTPFRPASWRAFS